MCADEKSIYMLEHLFGSKTRVRLLRLLYRNPAQQYYVREMSREINSQINAVRHELQNLVKAGLVAVVENPTVDQIESTPGGTRCTWYALCQDHALYEEIGALILKSRVFDKQALANELQRISPNIHSMLFSGCLVGEEGCPIDLLLIGKTDMKKFDRIIKKYERDLGSTIRYTVFTQKEFKERQQMVDKFLYAIYQSPHVIVYGE